MPPRCPCLVLTRTYTSMMTISRTRKRYYAPRGILFLPRWILSHAYASIISLPALRSFRYLLFIYPLDTLEDTICRRIRRRWRNPAEVMGEKARFPSHPRRNVIIINIIDKRYASSIEEFSQRNRNSPRFKD